MKHEPTNRQTILLTTVQQVEVAMSMNGAGKQGLYTPKEMRLKMACLQMHRKCFAGRPLFFGRDDFLVCFLPAHPRIDDIERWRLYGWYSLFKEQLDELFETDRYLHWERFEGLDELQPTGTLPRYRPRTIEPTRITSTREFGGRFGKAYSFQNYQESLASSFAREMHRRSCDSYDGLFADFARGVDILSLLTAGFWYGDL